MKTKTIEFKDVKEHTIFRIGKDEFVKRPFKGGYNAFNLDTGDPCYIYINTLCEVKEDY